MDYGNVKSRRMRKRDLKKLFGDRGETLEVSKKTGKPVTSSSRRIIKIRDKKKLGRKTECTLCGKVLSDRRNLNRHLRSVHDVQPKVRKLRVKCSFINNCSFVCATSAILRSHLESVHGLTIVHREYHFENRSEFEKWREEEESRTHVSYVSDTGVKHRNKKKIYYLRCHRSGYVRAEENVNKKRSRSKPLRGYTQCGFTCPSSMQLVENENGEINVCYFPMHLGHGTDSEAVKYMKLSKKEKEEIAAKLVQGEPVSKIVCEAHTKKGDKLSRVNFLQKRDVYNIKSKVTFLEKEGDQDGINIGIWVNNFNLDGLNNNPIALYVPIEKNNDYILIIIHHIQKIIFSLLFDGSMVYVKTKKGKANIDFNLTAVYMVNENGDGYPLAYCVSSKSDYSTILTFFKIIFENYGLITAQIFISDNISYYYVAWKNIMGESENKLICNFNTHALWDQRLLELKCPFRKHEEVSNKLKSLLNELDPDVFDSELLNVLSSWSEDDELKPFVKFFYKCYSKKPFEWANCYRIHSVRKENINKYLEPLLDQVDQIYAEGVKNIHHALNSIFLLIRNECYISLSKWDEDILLDNIKKIEKNHVTSKDISNIIFDGTEWIIRYMEENFRVQKEENNCLKECGLTCYSCDICVHSFRCSCSEYLANFSICEHIHAVVTWSASKKMDITCVDAEKYLVSSALKYSAVSLSKTITNYLQRSELTDLQYDKVILDLDKLIKEHSLKDKYEDACCRKTFWDKS